MKQQVSILGCGWLGMPLARALIQEGFQVLGSTTTPSKLSELESLGIRPFLIDIHKEDQLHSSSFLSSDILIIAITSKSIEDFQLLIDSIAVSPVKRVLFVSSTSVYPMCNGVVTEQTKTLDTPLARIEHLFLSQKSFETSILRFGGLFGATRQPLNFIRAKVVAHPEGYINFIHQEDGIAIILKMIQMNRWSQILNVCSDSHPKRRDFYIRLTQKAGVPTPVFDESTPCLYKIVDSQKLKTLLDYQFKYGDLMTI